MTTKDDFTADEWELVSGLPGMVLAAAAWSDGKLVPAMREVIAGGEVNVTLTPPSYNGGSRRLTLQP